MVTQVIHIRNTPPNFKSNPDYVYIGRGSHWGNPYRMRPCPAQLNARLPEDIAQKTLVKIQKLWAISERQNVINAYVAYLKYNTKLQASLHELKDKILVCYCAPLACHGDVLAKAADYCATVAQPDLDDLVAWFGAA